MSRRPFAGERFPVAPLLAAAEFEARRMGLENEAGIVPARHVARLLGMHEKTVSQWKVRHVSSISWQYADRYAVALGCHPALIWPDWFQENAA